MRFPSWISIAVLGVVAGVALAQGVRIEPRSGLIVFPPAAKLGVDPPIRFLSDFAAIYTALKKDDPPPKLGTPFIVARNMLDEPDNCTAPQAMHPFLELSTSFQRLEGQTEVSRRLASDREIVLTSVARYACADSQTLKEANGVATVPGYDMMSRLKGTFIETIAPRKLTVLPGTGSEQSTALQNLGDVSQRLRTDPGAPSAPDSFAGMLAALREINKLPPGEREKAAQELEARIKQPQTQKAMQAQLNEIARPLAQTLGPNRVPPPRPLAFLDQLRPDEAYVDLYKYYVREGTGFGGLHYLAVVSDGKGSRLIRLGAAEPIDNAISAYMANLQERATFAANWKELQRLVTQPVLAALPADARTIWLSPDAELFNLPFASLILEQRADLSVAVVPSAYDFSRLRAASTVPPGGKALLVGDLMADLPSGGAKAAVPLADIAVEFDAQKLKLETLRREQATLPAVMTQMKDAQYILFSTHGRWENTPAGTTEDTFGSAGIELWSEGSGPAVLTGADILRNDLSQTDLVVLLACETARGQPVNGQGSFGFQSAFMGAGARSLLVALWRVPADASKELIQHFYAGLFKRHLSRAEALKQAQLALRGQARFADPWNWGGWVLIGDPRPVQ
jgi:CHAT domain-containing protein